LDAANYGRISDSGNSVTFETQRRDDRNEGEIDLRIAALKDMPEQADDDPADAVPELPTRPPLSKIGDVWLRSHSNGAGSVSSKSLISAP